MLKKFTTAALAASAVTAMMVGGASTAVAGDTYLLLKQASKDGVTARLWLNKRTRALHGEAVNIRKGEMVRMDRNYTIRETIIAQTNRASLNTSSYSTYPDSYSVCAGSPVGGPRFICTPYHRHNG
ncbi:hypothetical protein NLX83_27700 [Allokutzneria sp. A3M-2-11 16]|uniref:hypothetical protein n=1 Tax=Allokutzneria sp. A3M-2-11 16 TaxID=2962043 RepID=UPI0020B8AD7E|nr:hypothetical protein [Allokutzneria sp. A3M-2-11 16]MCP3803066.1 hypothetical protein [Allokutzneria sp. A3M-2-11 16]